MIITQIVPPEWCFKCDVCCRFPEKDSFLAPYFTHDEILTALAYVAESAHAEGTAFYSVLNPPPHGGCKISLIPFEEGFICPEFNPVSAHCKIYDVRPFDCIIYPFALMWSAEGKEILLGVDMKCPYIAEFINSESLRDAYIEMSAIIDSSPVLDIISKNPAFIGPYQHDVSHAETLINLTQEITCSRYRGQN
ncbi:MAG: YkgJ family cysteine cluster protein [Nitrospirae bacterium]|nr:YkgJ family cysteine cluster protein [Nitrospirota bacterium]